MAGSFVNDILVDDRWIGNHGIGRFAREVIARIGTHYVIGQDIPLLSIQEPYLLSRKLSRTKAQVYFSPGYNPPLWSKLPYVITVHDLNHLYVTDNSSLAKRLYYSSILRSGCRRAFRVLTVSDFSRQQILAWSGLDRESIVNVGNGVGSEFRPEGKIYEPGYPYFLYVGNRKAHKNIGRLLKAYSTIDMRFDIRLILSGEKTPSITDRLRVLNIEDNVFFAGEISDSDLPAYYRGAVALVFPSLYEGFGLPVIESMACGTPVITSNIASLPEIAGGAAMLVDPIDIASIAQAMQRIGSDSLLRNELSRAGLCNAARFNWDRTAAMVKDVLDDACKYAGKR